MFCQCLTLLIPPLVDSFMIAGQQNLWRGPVFPVSRQGIMRVFEQAIAEAFIHAGATNECKVNVKWIHAEELDGDNVQKALTGLDGILVAPGFGERGIEGKIYAVQYARENKIPFFGICLGMQVAVIEYARNMAGLSDAHSTEFVEDTSTPVVGLITEWRDEDGSVQQRDVDSDLGDTMRLGAQECRLVEGSLSRKMYDKEVVYERHRHRYEVNNKYVPQLEKAGLRVAGRSMDGGLVEMIEVVDHPWFVACQFHPEFTSTPRDGHALFSGYVQAAKAFKDAKASAKE